MSFDMGPRPVDSNRQGMPVHLLSATQAGAASSDYTAGRVKTVSEIDESDANGSALQQEKDDGEQDKEGRKSRQLDIYTRKKIVELARIRGMASFTLGEDQQYRLHLNPQTGLVELIELLDEADGQVLMTLTPEELTALAQATHRYAGLLEDIEG